MIRANKHKRYKRFLYYKRAYEFLRHKKLTGFTYLDWLQKGRP
jgi:hypothetical protein